MSVETHEILPLQSSLAHLFAYSSQFKQRCGFLGSPTAGRCRIAVVADAVLLVINNIHSWIAERATVARKVYLLRDADSNAVHVPHNASATCSKVVLPTADCHRCSGVEPLFKGDAVFCSLFVRFGCV